MPPHARIAARELALTADALIRALLRLAPARCLALLDSGAQTNRAAPHPHPHNARFLIAGFDPFEVVETHEGDEPDALATLDAQLRDFHQLPVSADARFPLVLPGACIATLAYDLECHRGRTRIPRHTSTDSDIEPDAVLAFYDSLVIHDYKRSATYITSIAGANRLANIEAELFALAADAQRDAHPATHGAPIASPSLHAISNFTRNEYIAAVERIQDHIRRGDIYQANLTQQLACRLAPDDTPASLFLRLRRQHPAAFAAFLHRRADTIVSISPERFLRVWHDGVHRRVEAAPVKGTRPRGNDAEADARLRHELTTSAKDRAENIMIVDLMRNDLGRVCRYGSIEVTELCRVEQHPTLFHLVSTVQGVLRDDVTAADLLRAAFPCGSITGAPKIRAMEIIRDLEPAPRGLSMGSIGYFSFDGALDLNVAIRTMTIRNHTARFNVGGGVVIDSDPASEYDESLTKARALLAALNANLASTSEF